MTLNIKIGGFMHFLTILGCISRTTCAEINWDRQRQAAYKFI